MSPQGKRYLPWTPPCPKDLVLSSLTPLLITQLVLGGIVCSSLACLTPTLYLGVAYGSSLQCSYPPVLFCWRSNLRPCTNKHQVSMSTCKCQRVRHCS